VNEGDSLSLGADARGLIHQLDSCVAALGEGRVEIIHREADVMNPRPPLRQEARDGRFLVSGLEQLYERLTRVEADDPRSVGIFEVDLGQSKDVPKERQAICEGLHGDANVGDLRAAWG